MCCSFSTDNGDPVQQRADVICIKSGALIGSFGNTVQCGDSMHHAKLRCMPFTQLQDRFHRVLTGDLIIEAARPALFLCETLATAAKDPCTVTWKKLLGSISSIVVYPVRC